MKTRLYIAASLMLSATAFSQTLQEAITKTENERYDAAASDFRALIASQPNKGDNYFYFGENYFNRGEIDSANIYYSKGAELNATYPLNYVGLGKVLLSKNNINDAKAMFYKAASLSQNKNAEVFRRTAEAWLATDNKNPDEAINQANLAIKLDAKNPENYIVLGDAQLEKNPTDGSTPIKSYSKATELNPKSAKGILREGKLYQRGRNYNLALEKYKAALAIDATFAPAYREIAELYFLAAQPAKSIENWKKYLELNNSVFARYRYMSAFFKNKQYQDAINEYESIAKSNFNNVYLHRLGAYSYYENGDKTDKEAYSKGLKALETFFEKAGPNFKYIGSDYKYKGYLLMKTGKDSLGLIELEKAMQLDTALTGEIYSEVANTSYKNKKYDKAILYYEKKIARSKGSMTNNDWFNLGRSNYYTAGAKQNEAAAIKDAKKKAALEAEAVPYLVKADSAFSALVRMNPNWSTAYIWRGRTNALLDPKAEKDLAKVQFEKVLSVIKPEDKATTGKKDVIEAHEYLGYYYVTKKDKANADASFNAIKELDPANQKAKDYFAPPKPGGAKPAGK